MYGLPPEFDGAFFVGRTIEVISFTINSVFFAFDENVSLTVESSFEHRLPTDEERGALQRAPVDSSSLMQLIGRPVVATDLDNDGTLILRFTDRHELRCFDDLPNYECYRITFGKDEIIV